MHYLFFLITLLLIALNGCTSHNKFYNPYLPHHTKSGFTNPYSKDFPNILGLVNWGAKMGVFSKDTYEPVIVEPDLESIYNPPNDKIQVTWIGHATFLVQFHGLNILTDPVFGNRASPLSFIGPKRHGKPGLTIEELPPIDIVSISHNHYDHLDSEAIKQLKDGPVFFVPLGMKSWFLEKTVPKNRIVELDWWQESVFKEAKIHFVPAKHFSNRGLFDLNETLWGGWVIEYQGRSFYFSGDTGYSPDFRRIGRRFGPIDLAIIPIGSYDPYMSTRTLHVVPRQSVMIHKDVRAKQSIAMHWGSFKLTREPLAEPPILLKKALDYYKIDPKYFITMHVGETTQY